MYVYEIVDVYGCVYMNYVYGYMYMNYGLMYIIIFYVNVQEALPQAKLSVLKC